MMGQPVTAVVLGAQHPTGLMTARALREWKIPIVGIAYGESPCLCSNVWSSLYMIEKSSAAVISAINEIAAGHEGACILLPSDDESVKILSDQRELLPPSCILLMPEAETVDLLLDKSRFYPWAKRHGFAVPETIHVTDVDELERAIREIGYPLLLKPIFRTDRWDKEIPRDKVFILNDPRDYSAIPANIFSIAPVLLAQQWIPGTDADIYFCLVCYDRNGTLIDYFCGRKLMQWPPQGGSTAIAVSDEQDESLESTLAIFNTVGYRGLGSMEYKKDHRSGRLYIMEPTVGRNDFQSLLAVTGDVNLTGLALQDALGRPGNTRSCRRRSAWICESSLFHSVIYYLRHGNWFFLRFLRLLFRKTGFAYIDQYDMAPFRAFVKGRCR